MELRRRCAVRRGGDRAARPPSFAFAFVSPVMTLDRHKGAIGPQEWNERERERERERDGFTFASCRFIVIVVVVVVAVVFSFSLLLEGGREGERKGGEGWRDGRDGGQMNRQRRVKRGRTRTEPLAPRQAAPPAPGAVADACSGQRTCSG